MYGLKPEPFTPLKPVPFTPLKAVPFTEGGALDPCASMRRPDQRFSES